ncbi:hemicentin-2 [Brachyistius frenatus]|uniref:hemicentin-2 n=1 Tax=Brachyistius frenatus TaxID=100188 RepID=UPI0037E75547
MSESTLFVRLVVGLLLIATGVHGSCPIELSPPRVVVKYGGRVSVNCTTSESQYRGIGWEASQNGTGVQQVNPLPWTVESLTDWDITTFCFLNLHPKEQCLKTLDIVLYKFPETINISSSDGVLKEGEKSNFTCDILNIAPVQNLIVRWYKGDAIISTQHYRNINSKKPVNQSSVYSFTPTRQDNGATFRCEASMDLGPEGPQFIVTSQENNITVFFAPEILCSAIELSEEETLANKCSVTGNPTPDIRWLKDGQPFNWTVPLRRESAGMYSIEAKGFSSVQKDIPVLVLYGPKLTCPSSYIALENTPHSLTCTVEGFPEPEMIWYKDGGEVELLENLTRSDGGQYLITASNVLSSVNATVDIIVLYPPSPIVELDDTEVDVGSTVSLKCSSTGNPRPKYSWSYYKMANVVEKNEDGVSLLVIGNATAYNMGSYTCHAWNGRGSVSKMAKVTVTGAKQECPIKITPDTMVMPYRSKSQPVTCTSTSTNSSNVIGIYWQAGRNGTVWFPNTHEDWDARPVCTGTFRGRGKCDKPLNFILYKTPDIVSLRGVNDSSSVVEGREFQLQCDVLNVSPVQNLSVRWYRGNKTIEPGSMRLTGCHPENNSNCDISAIRSPVNVSSTVIVTLDRKDNGAEFRCEAQLDLGHEGPQPSPTTSTPLNITVFYKPIINTTKLPKAIPVFRGYPEQLDCEADGHPPPKIQWLYSSGKKTSLSEGKLTVFEAGLYNCTATNDVDSATYVVHVVLKEDYLPLIAGFVAVIVVAISIIFLFIYSIYYKNTKMRRYSLKNPKLSTHNGNVAHNGWDLPLPMTKLSYGLIACIGSTMSDSCPAEVNPPHIVVRFGDSFSANCTSLTSLITGMGWESTTGGTGTVSGVTYLSLNSNPVDDWDISSRCFLNLPNELQCMVHLPVIVYKMPQSVSMSQTSSEVGPMVEGRQYRFQCGVDDVAPASSLVVYWHKGNETFPNETFVESRLSPVSKSSVLTLTAHRSDNGTQIWCEAKLNLLPGQQNPAAMSSKSQEVIVHFPPTFLKPANETLELPARASLALDCMAKGNPMPEYSWLLPHPAQETNKNQHVDQPILILSFQLPGVYTCIASNTQGTSTKVFTVVGAARDRTTFAAIFGVFVSLGILLVIGGLVFVTPDGTFSLNKGNYLPGQPTSSGPFPAELPRLFKLEFFSLSTLNRRLSTENNMGNNFLRWIVVLCTFCSVSGEGCSLILKPSRVVVGFGEAVLVSCEAARPVRVLGWESAISATHTQEDRSVQWKVDSLIDWIEEPICYGVFFTAPRQCEEKLNLVLYKTPDSVSIRQVNHTGPMVEGKEYQLLCEVQNIAPVQYLTLRWYRAQTEVYNHSFSDLTSSSPVQVSSILVITPTKAENGAQYRCVAELELGPEGPQPPPSVTSEPLNASVYFPPTFLSPEIEVMDFIEGAEMTLNCTATGNPIPVYSWQTSSPMPERMEDEAVVTSSSLHPGTYTCTASNMLEKKSKQFIVKEKTKGI